MGLRGGRHIFDETRLRKVSRLQGFEDFPEVHAKQRMKAKRLCFAPRMEASQLVGQSVAALLHYSKTSARMDRQGQRTMAPPRGRGLSGRNKYGGTAKALRKDSNWVRHEATAGFL
jgi:hypothetical protein